MQTRSDYDQAFAIVGEIVRSCDPYRLMEGGAPADELDGEIAKIVTFVPRISSPSAAAEAIAAVFSSAFGPPAYPASEFAVAGAELFAKLSAAGLVSRA